MQKDNIYTFKTLNKVNNNLLMYQYTFVCVAKIK